MLGAAKAAELQAVATTSAGVPDPLDTVAVAVRTLVAHIEHFDGQVATLGARLGELPRQGRRRQARDGARRRVHRVLMLAAEVAARMDPQCHAILQKRRAKGKHSGVAVSQVARKLVHILYAVLTHERPYALPAAYAPPPESPTELRVGT